MIKLTTPALNGLSIADVAGFFNDALLDDTLEKLHTACWVTAVLMNILSSELESRDNR